MFQARDTPFPERHRLFRAGILVYEFASGGGFGSTRPPPAILAEGRAMRDALCADLAAAGLAVTTVATPGAPAVAGIPCITASPASSPADFLACHAADYRALWLIAPESEGIAARLSASLEQRNTTMLGCSSHGIALAGSKSSALARLAAAGVATVPTWPLANAPLASHDLWVVKPDSGCGCEGMARLAAADVPARGDGAGPTAIAQPWLNGRPLSLSLLITGERTELLSVNHQHISIGPDGSLALLGLSRCHDLSPALREQLAALGRRIVAAIPGLAGFIGVDLILTTEQRAVVLEVNPRVTSAYVGLSQLLGRNLAGDIVKAHLPELLPRCLQTPHWSAGMSVAPT